LHFHAAPECIKGVDARITDTRVINIRRIQIECGVASSPNI